jgi:hypothetical protein
MTTNRVTHRTRLGSKSLAVLVVLVAALALFPVAALAHGHGNGHGKQGKHGHSGKHGYAAYPVVVPRVIVHTQHGWYDPYYAGSAYYGPHRHVHSSYRFPVHVGQTVVYRPYAYCGDSLFVPEPVYVAPVVAAPGGVPAPQPPLAIGWNVATSGFAVSGTYFGH